MGVRNSRRSGSGTGSGSGSGVHWQGAAGDCSASPSCMRAPAGAVRRGQTQSHWGVPAQTQGERGITSGCRTRACVSAATIDPFALCGFCVRSHVSCVGMMTGTLDIVRCSYEIICPHLVRCPGLVTCPSLFLVGLIQSSASTLSSGCN